MFSITALELLGQTFECSHMIFYDYYLALCSSSLYLPLALLSVAMFASKMRSQQFNQPILIVLLDAIASVLLQSTFMNVFYYLVLFSFFLPFLLIFHNYLLISFSFPFSPRTNISPFWLTFSFCIYLVGSHQNLKIFPQINRIHIMIWRNCNGETERERGIRRSGMEKSRHTESGSRSVCQRGKIVNRWLIRMFPFGGSYRTFAGILLGPIIPFSRFVFDPFFFLASFPMSRNHNCFLSLYPFRKIGYVRPSSPRLALSAAVFRTDYFR